MTKLESLLMERASRLRGTDREIVAIEDWIRCKQGWRRPFYRVDSPENGWPPKWIKR